MKKYRYILNAENYKVDMKKYSWWKKAFYDKDTLWFDKVNKITKDARILAIADKYDELEKFCKDNNIEYEKKELEPRCSDCKNYEEKV